MDTGVVGQSVGFTVLDPFEVNHNYNVTDLPAVRARFMEYSESQRCRHEATDIIGGNINFSRIDKTNFIVSGIFEFSTVSGTCDTVQITEGRFDIKYIS